MFYVLYSFTPFLGAHDECIQLPDIYFLHGHILLKSGGGPQSVSRDLGDTLCTWWGKRLLSLNSIQTYRCLVLLGCGCVSVNAEWVHWRSADQAQSQRWDVVSTNPYIAIDSDKQECVQKRGTETVENLEAKLGLFSAEE